MQYAHLEIYKTMWKNDGSSLKNQRVLWEHVRGRCNPIQEQERSPLGKWYHPLWNNKPQFIFFFFHSSYPSQRKGSVILSQRFGYKNKCNDENPQKMYNTRRCKSRHCRLIVLSQCKNTQRYWPKKVSFKKIFIQK